MNKRNNLPTDAEIQDDPIGALEKLLEIEKQHTALDSNMDAGAGSGAMGRFALLQGESESPQQAYEDALALTGLPIFAQDIPLVGNPDMLLGVPMRYSLLHHHIEINPNIIITRALAAQYMAEELLHSIDHVGNGCTLSAGSRRFSLQHGDIALEVIRHYNNYGYFTEFLDYPLGEEYEHEFTQDRIKAELFARLGVLYLAEPSKVKKLLPLTYEVFHGIFGLSTSTPFNTEYVRSKVWNATRGDSQMGLQHRTTQSIQSSITASYRQQPTNHGLATFRTTLAKLLDSPSNGRKAKL